VPEVGAAEIDPRRLQVLRRGSRFGEAMNDARLGEASASQGARQAVLADELEEAVEGLVVRDDRELADLVADRDGSVREMRGIDLFDFLALELRVEDERCVAIDRQAGVGSQLGEAFERGDGGESLDGARG
jgi:hypothetical protein